MQKTGRGSVGKLIMKSVFFACLGFALCCVMLLTGAALVERQVLPNIMIAPMAWGSVAFSMLCAAFFAAGNDKGRIITGLCVGVIYFMLALVCGTLLGGELDCGKTAIMASLILADAIAGAILSGLIRG